MSEKKCENCIWFNKNHDNSCGNYLCKNMSEYDELPVIFDVQNVKEPDIDILIHSALDAGATVRKVKPGDGGFFVNERKLSENDLEECLMEES